ncbi:MAG: hypothetical protein ACLPKT_01015, partial [Methylocella sp.]
DLAEAAAGVRSIAPDAIFVLLPWSATATIERCAETFQTLPVELHLGPEEVLHKFDDAKLSTIGQSAHTVWPLIGALWVSTALVTLGAVYAISALVG